MDMLKISEFASFCDVSVRTLQLYDRLELFKPAYVNPANGYRYYDENQMMELNTIISFRRVGFKLHEIADMKKNNYSKEQVMRCLKNKLSEQIQRIQELQNNNENIEEMLNGLGLIDLKEWLKEEYLVAKTICSQNEDMEHDFSQIIWL